MTLTTRDIDVATAAERADRSERQIRRWCKSGKLIYRMEKGAYLIDPISLEQLISETLEQTVSDEDALSDNGRNLEPETLSPSTPEQDTQPDADIRTSPADVRTSDIDEDIAPGMPPDITALSKNLRAVKQALHSSEEAMSDTADLLFQYLCFETRRNRDIEGRLHGMIQEFGIQPAQYPRWRKTVRQFSKFLPWILFGISTAAALLLRR
jgi:hypothetical protein